MEVLLFGIAKDIVGRSPIMISGKEAQPTSVQELKEFLIKEFPDFAKLTSFAVAVNNEYASGDVSLTDKDEIAIIPPVSGG